MNDIKSFIHHHLLEPLKNYPTIIQDSMIEIIADRLEELYELTVQFPEIISPNKNRIDLLETIADQFLFKIREEADMDEQLSILENILYLYRRRGSIDTVENMWVYYGGDLPRDIKVVIPSHNLFRYSVSNFSGTDKFVRGDASYVVLDTEAPQDIPEESLAVEVGTDRYRAVNRIIKGSTRVFLYTVDDLSVGSRLDIAGIYEGTILDIYNSPKEGLNRTGVYEIRLTNNYYPVADLREFFIKELAAAGNYFYFTNALHLDVSELDSESNYYRYLVQEETLVNLQLTVLKAHQGLNWSGINELSRRSEDSAWSGRRDIFLELTTMMELPLIAINTYKDYLEAGFSITSIRDIGEIEYTESDELKYSITSMRFREWSIRKNEEKIINNFLYCTPTDTPIYITRNLYNSQGELVESNYPGYFVLGETPLGKEVI